MKTNVIKKNRKNLNITENSSTVVTEERPRRNIRKPQWQECYETNFICLNSEPFPYKDAMKRKDKNKWLEAINNELTTLKENNMWTEISDIPEECQIVSSKWIFKMKDLPNGDVQYKARLVARGFEQTDWDLHVYAPVASLPTFRILMAIANKKRLAVHQMDVTGAFLYGEIKDNVYMRLPDERVCKLNKSIYGLKSSPKCWNEKFDSFMRNLSFVRSRNDYCLYSKREGSEFLHVLLYVDDMVFWIK